MAAADLVELRGVLLSHHHIALQLPQAHLTGSAGKLYPLDGVLLGSGACMSHSPLTRTGNVAQELANMRIQPSQIAGAAHAGGDRYGSPATTDTASVRGSHPNGAPLALLSSLQGDSTCNR